MTGRVVALVGCGRWGSHILRDLRTLGCEVPVVARSEASRARAVEGSAAAIVRNVRSLPVVEGVVVATTTSTHATVLDEVLALDVPVFVEKPLCTDTSDAARLATGAPDRLFVMDKWRYHPGILELAAIARDGRLGRVSGLTTVRLSWGMAHDDVDAIWVLAPHDLAIALEIMGAVPRARAAAMQLVAGRMVQLAGLLEGDGWWHAIEVSSRSPERRRRVALHCEAGVAVLGGGWDEHVSIFRAGSKEPVEERVHTEGELPLLAELRAFLEHLDGAPPPRSSATDGAAMVSAISDLRRLAGEP